MARAVALCLALALGVEGARIKATRRPQQKQATCGSRGPGSAVARNGTSISIVNGQPAAECDWKWQVGLRSFWPLPASCGGMLISPEWVLTAAHCVGSMSINVVAGKYNLYWSDDSEQSVWSDEVIRHPAYSSSTMEWDIALIHLATPVEMTECVGTVCLPRRGEDVAPGSKCWITGWGTLSSGGLIQPRHLQEGEVTVLSNQECQDTSYPADQIRDSMLCAQGQNADGSIVDACQGDSGGPLVCQDGESWGIFGATSWGRGCAGADYPGVWARVHEALDWIDETMAR